MKLAKLLVFTTIYTAIIPANAKIQTIYNKQGCGIIDRKSFYETSSFYTKFRIRWDSRSMESAKKRAEFCYDSDKKLYDILKKDRDMDISKGIAILFWTIILSTMFTIHIKTKDKK